MAPLPGHLMRINPYIASEDPHTLATAFNRLVEALERTGNPAYCDVSGVPLSEEGVVAAVGAAIQEAKKPNVPIAVRPPDPHVADDIEREESKDGHWTEYQAIKRGYLGLKKDFAEYKRRIVRERLVNGLRWELAQGERATVDRRLRHNRLRALGLATDLLSAAEEIESLEDQLDGCQRGLERRDRAVRSLDAENAQLRRTLTTILSRSDRSLAEVAIKGLHEVGIDIVLEDAEGGRG